MVSWPPLRVSYLFEETFPRVSILSRKGVMFGDITGFGVFCFWITMTLVRISLTWSRHASLESRRIRRGFLVGRYCSLPFFFYNEVTRIPMGGDQICCQYLVSDDRKFIIKSHEKLIKFLFVFELA